MILIDSVFATSRNPSGTHRIFIHYLRRYSHRIAISNSRIREVEGDLVTFSMKDYRDGKKKLISIKATDFIRRFLLYVLP